jgi:hypothetical protein
VSVKATTKDKNASIEWSNDNATWNAYDAAAGVSTNTNTTFYFRTTDKYGNQSASTKYIVNNIQVLQQLKPVFYIMPFGKKTAVTIGYNRLLSMNEAMRNKIQYSTDGGKHWSNYGMLLTFSKDTTLQARVKLADGTYSDIVEQQIHVAAGCRK